MTGISVLFITTSFPPFPESQSIRTSYFVKALARSGASVTVLAPSLAPLPVDDALDCSREPNVKIVRFGKPIFDRAVGVIDRISVSGVGPFLQRVLALVAGRLVAPDVRADWAISAYRASLRLCKKEPFHLIVSSSGSNSAHLAALALRKWKGIPWVVDLGDPWSKNPLRPASAQPIKFFNQLIEPRCLRNADGIVTTTEECTQSIARDLPGGKAPIVTIPCGYSSELMQSVARAPSPVLTFAYVGTAHRGSRDLSKAISAIDLAMARLGQQAKLKVVGSYSKSFEAMSLSNVSLEFFGWMDYRASLQEMERADVLLLVGNKGTLQIPAKVYSYLGAARPILYLGQLDRESDPTARLLAQFEGIVFLDEVELSEKLRDLPRLSLAAASESRRSKLERLSWISLGKNFSDFASSIAQGRRS